MKKNGIETPRKPLGGKAYGSIPHLPGSTFGNREDKGVNEKAARFFLEKAGKNDRIILLEKLDGSCVCVANVAGDLVPLNRAGYLASSSPYIQHHVFVDWVEENRERFSKLRPGERICGEWLAQAHGTLYDLTDRDPFVAFDLFRDDIRQYYHELQACYPGAVAPILRTSNHGMGVSVTDALAHLGRRGMYGAQEHAEGCVWRWERPDLSRNPIMLAKYVRPEKAPGKYLESQTGREPIWNWTLTREEPKNENTL